MALTDAGTAAVRAQFPALARTHDGRTYAYLDGPGGTQVPHSTIEAMARYLETCNANHEGAFATSEESDAVLAAAHSAAADFLGAGPDEVFFGQNMTTLTFAFSRAIGRTLKPGDEIVVTRLDHDANVAPWLHLEEERGVRVRWVEIDRRDCTLDMKTFEAALGPRTRLVAVGLASNAVGTINPVSRISALAHAAGALTYVDAVHAAPHLALDVAALGTDFLVCSPYKFFGPHLGLLYGRRELLERMAAYKVRPSSDETPGKWETGTLPGEALAGLVATFEYLEWLGSGGPSGLSGGAEGKAAAPASGGASGGAEGKAAAPASGGASGGAGRPASSAAAAPASGAAATTRRHRLRAAMAIIGATERELARRALTALGEVPGLELRGIVDPGRLAERVPTFAFTLAGHSPREVATQLGRRGIAVWDGDYYAYELIRALGLAESGGMVRVGFVHYNTPGEIERLAGALHEIAATGNRKDSR